MSDCPSSDKIQNAVIPALTCENPAPESILRLPTTLPGVVGVGELESDYQLTAADVNTVWNATYYQIASGSVSIDTNNVICIDNTSTDYDTFTWVDWLTPAQQLEQGRDWIKQPECSMEGGSGGLTVGPVRPLVTRQPIVSLPMPSVTVNKYGSGGGGGEVIVQEQDMAFQMEVTGMQLRIRPGRVYVHDNKAKSVCFQYGEFSSAQDCVIKGNTVPVAFNALDNAIYLIVGYVTYDANQVSDYGVLVFADTRDLYRLPNLPGFFCWIIGRVEKSRNALTIIEQEHCFSVFADAYMLSQSFSLHFEFDLGDVAQIKYVTNAFRTPKITLSGGIIYDDPHRIRSIAGITYENAIAAGTVLYAVLNRYSYTLSWTTTNPLSSNNRLFLVIASIGYQTTTKVDYAWKLNHPADLLSPPRYAGYFTIISTETGYSVIDGAGSGQSICMVNGSNFTVTDTVLEGTGQYILLIYQAPYPSGVTPPDGIKYGTYVIRSSYSTPSALGIRYCAYKQIGRILSVSGTEYIQQDHMSGIPEIMYFSRSCVSAEIEDEPESSSSTNE
nr:MAG TPA: hypothetical protein [Herelleviridae sp.]